VHYSNDRNFHRPEANGSWTKTDVNRPTEVRRRKLSNFRRLFPADESYLENGNFRRPDHKPTEVTVQ
jgi:hypothetical protein